MGSFNIRIYIRLAPFGVPNCSRAVRAHSVAAPPHSRDLPEARRVGGPAVAFVAEIDPAGLWAPIAKRTPIGTLTTINVAGVKRQFRVDANGRIVAENPVADDGWSNRGTFAGDAEAFGGKATRRRLLRIRVNQPCSSIGGRPLHETH